VRKYANGSGIGPSFSLPIRDPPISHTNPKRQRGVFPPNPPHQAPQNHARQPHYSEAPGDNTNPKRQRGVFRAAPIPAISPGRFEPRTATEFPLPYPLFRHSACCQSRFQFPPTCPPFILKAPARCKRMLRGWAGRPLVARKTPRWRFGLVSRILWIQDREEVEAIGKHACHRFGAPCK
jgi:hypothetical protein